MRRSAGQGVEAGTEAAKIPECTCACGSRGAGEELTADADLERLAHREGDGGGDDDLLGRQGRGAPLRGGQREHGAARERRGGRGEARGRAELNRRGRHEGARARERAHERQGAESVCHAAM